MSTDYPIPKNPRFQNLTDFENENWHILEYRGGRKWLAQCKRCGRLKMVAGHTIKSKQSRSCGCLQKAITAKMNKILRRGTTHGLARSSEYRIWQMMIRRCTDSRAIGYHNYGGRGIRVCREWLGKGGFERFIDHVGRRPSYNHSLDRFPNNNGNYAPGNVRWATRREQALNRRNNRYITAFGRKQTITEWSLETGIKVIALRNRIDRGWTSERAVSEPSHGNTEYMRELRYRQEFFLWQNMIRACHNPKTYNYDRYGAKGIRVCRRWKDSYEDFLKDMGPVPEPLCTVGRYDETNDFSPENCYWRTRKDRQRKAMKTNTMLTYLGQTKCVSEWAECVDLHKDIIYARLKNNWPVEKTLNTPVRKRRDNRLVTA